MARTVHKNVDKLERPPRKLNGAVRTLKRDKQTRSNEKAKLRKVA